MRAMALPAFGKMVGQSLSSCIPGIALVTEPFRQTGAAMAGTWGLPGFRFLDVPHPIAILGDKDLDERADRLAPLVAELLGARG